MQRLILIYIKRGLLTIHTIQLFTLSLHPRLYLPTPTTYARSLVDTGSDILETPSCLD